MTILPAGAATLNTLGRPQTTAFKESAFFWTTTNVHGDTDQDVYIKEFDWNRCGVYQVAECPSPYYSVRLVKDFDGSNYRGIVDFDGITYDTLLFPESGQIWLGSNYAGKENIDAKNYTEVNDGEVLEKRIEYYINEWNGKYWERKRMNEGDSVIIENSPYDCSGKTKEICWQDSEGINHCVDVVISSIDQNNVEYRVYTENDSCDKILVNADDTVVERVLDVVVPMLEKETYEREEADKALSGAIDDLADVVSALTEDVETISGDVADLREDLEQEIKDRESADTELWEALSAETSARESADTELWDALSAETEARISADTILEEMIDEEIARAKAAEDEISGLTIVTTEDYILSASTVDGNYNLVLPSKDGNPDHFIKIKFDGNFGEF